VTFLGYIKGRKLAEYMREWDAGEDILAYVGGSNKRLEKIL